MELIKALYVQVPVFLSGLVIAAFSIVGQVVLALLGRVAPRVADRGALAHVRTLRRITGWVLAETNPEAWAQARAQYDRTEEWLKGRLA